MRISDWSSDVCSSDLTDLVSRSGFDPIGRGGTRLRDHWADGMRTLHGIHTHGFTNLFLVQLAQGANHIANVPHNMSEDGATLAAVVGHAGQRGSRPLEPTAEADEAGVGRAAAGASPPASSGLRERNGEQR